MPKLNLQILYDRLFEAYGPQGWWPLLSIKNKSKTSKDPLKRKGYHPEDYDLPNENQGILEIMLGAILTQNTAWIRAETALEDLQKQNCLSLPALQQISQETLAEYIRTSGFYNQKSRSIKNLLKFLKKYPIKTLKTLDIQDLRKCLLNVKGIGPETADSIILYGFLKPIFVVDAYTRRLLLRLGIFEKAPTYIQVQKKAHADLPPKVPLYNEYHALIVKHCVSVCKKTPLCQDCFLNNECSHNLKAKNLGS